MVQFFGPACTSRICCVAVYVFSMVCAVDVLCSSWLPFWAIYAVFAGVRVCFGFSDCCKLWRGYMGKWSQYRVRYQVEWEDEDDFRGERLLHSV